MKKHLVGILLAAGESKRFGSQKLLQILPDSQIPVSVQSAKNLLNVVPNSIAVIRADNQELKSELTKTGIAVIENPDANLGMSTSIRCAIEKQLSNKTEIQGWIIALADMPFIPVLAIRQVADAILQGALVAAPEFNKQRGHPVGFSFQLTDELLKLEGDIGARPVLEKHQSELKLIKCKHSEVLRDVDYLSDLSS